MQRPSNLLVQFGHIAVEGVVVGEGVLNRLDQEQHPTVCVHAKMNKLYKGGPWSASIFFALQESHPLVQKAWYWPKCVLHSEVNILLHQANVHLYDWISQCSCMLLHSYPTASTPLYNRRYAFVRKDGSFGFSPAILPNFFCARPAARLRLSSAQQQNLCHR